jgi:hypothetical protein
VTLEGTHVRHGFKTHGTYPHFADRHFGNIARRFNHRQALLDYFQLRLNETQKAD